MNNFIAMFSSTGVRWYGRRSFSLRAFSMCIYSQMFLLIIGLGLMKASLAANHEDLQITKVVQLYGNPVVLGDTVSYTLTVENGSDLNNKFPEIRIETSGENISSSFISDQCSDDGYGVAFYCPEIGVGQSVQHTFTWLEPPEGDHNLVFTVGCARCVGGSYPLTTIVVVPPEGSIQFSNANYQVREEDGRVAIEMTRTGGSAGAMSVQVLANTENGDTATAGQDYAFPSSQMPAVFTWSDGDVATKIIYIDIVDDGLEEGDEVVSLQLRNWEDEYSVLGNPYRATLTIMDSAADPVVNQLKIISGNYQRGAQGDTLAPFVLSVADASGNPVAGVAVDWKVWPVEGGELYKTTETNTDGRANNTLMLNTSDRLVVTAAVGSKSVTYVVNGSLAERTGLSGNQRAVARAMDSACSALKTMEKAEDALSFGRQDLLNTCANLEDEDLAVVTANLDLLAHEEVSTQGRAAIETAKLQSAGIHNRMTALRAGTQGVSLSGLTVNIDGKMLPKSIISALFGSGAQGGSAGEEVPSIASRWGGFLNANITIGDRSQTDQETGFDFRAQGITAGVDYRISNALVVGSALSYGSKDSDFKANAGNLDMASRHLVVYGSYYQSEKFYLDGLIRVGKNNIETNRRINLMQEGVGSTTGWEYAASLSGGYEYSHNELTAGPYGRLGYIQTSIDGYTESASNPGNPGAGSILMIGNQDIDSITAVLGGKITYAISTRTAVYLLQLNGEWEHEFTDDSRAIAAQFVYDPTRTSFDISSDNPDRNYFNLGLGVTAVFANGRSGFIHYESRLGQDNVRQFWINGGIRLEL